MASSSHNDENFDEHFDQYFDEHFDQTFENIFIHHGDQQEERKRRKKRVYVLPISDKNEITFPWIPRKTPRSFVDFVDRVLVLHQHVPLNIFSLKCVDIVHPAIVIGWLLKVLEHGVLDLDLYISSVQGYPLPSEMFVSETLVRLKLEVRNVLTIDEVNDVFFPKVKSLLCLVHVMVKYSVFYKLLLGCQALEELVLDNVFEFGGSFSVSHNTLKRLVVGDKRTIDEHHKQDNIKLASVKLAMKYMKRVSAELEAKLLINLFICCMFSSQEDLMQRQTCIYSRSCFNFSSVQTVAPSSSFRILTSKSLVRLRESGTDEFTIIDVVEVSLSLPKLKTLHMNDVGFADESGAAFAKLVSSCHALEELVMDKIMWDFRGSCSDSNSSLKRVTIYSENIDDEDPKSVSLSALPISSL
uniref:F-box/LRR-repeat protein 15/At3g58940/PEG3-like LRR domain-containing protein n=2 Tax=Brassica oleracea var. oleracea TaxID=109376 RepID=A0A0D3DUB0_BRAOL